MMWVLFAFFAAFFESMKDVFSKKSFEMSEIDEYVAAWALRFFALPFLLPLLLFVEIPVIGDGFFGALIVSGIIGTATTILYMKAIKVSDLSVTVPMVNLTPIFLLITSPIMLGEFPNFFGYTGIVMIVIGAYFLNIREKNQGFFEPFRALFKERGSRLMLAVAFLWSISSNIDKIGILNSSPIFWAISINIVYGTTLFFLMLWKSSNNARVVSGNVKSIIPIGFFSAMTLVFQMTAISLTLVAYVISIKRTSTLMSVFWGGVLFREKHIRDRALGAAIMIIGVILITVFS